MPLAEDPGRPDGRVLLDGDGRAIARFQEAERDGRRVADLFTLAVAPELALPVVLAELAGWRVAADERFGRLLVGAGGRPKRHGLVMTRDLVRDPAPPAWLEPPAPAGVRLTAVDRPALDLAPARLAAYPREHPDYDHLPTPDRPDVELEELIAGRMMGPLLRCSGLAQPAARGIGAPLLRRALAVATRDGLPALSLAVTHGNPAIGLYEAHGFAAVLNSLAVEL